MKVEVSWQRFWRKYVIVPCAYTVLYWVITWLLLVAVLFYMHLLCKCVIKYLTHIKYVVQPEILLRQLKLN